MDSDLNESSWQGGVANLHQWPYPEKDTSPPRTAVSSVARRASTMANLCVPNLNTREWS